MEFQFEPTAYEQLRSKTSKKPTKAQLKKKLTIMSNPPKGLTPGMCYEKLKEAKAFAEENGLEFEKQEDLTIAAKQYLGLALDYKLGNGVFK